MTILNTLTVLTVLALAIAVTGYARWKWLLLEEERAYAAEPKPGVVTVTFTIDTTAFSEAMMRMQRSINDMATRMRAAQKSFAPAWEQVNRLAMKANDERLWRREVEHQRQLGLACVTAQVRAGLDPAYRTPEALHEYVAAIIDGNGRFGLMPYASRYEIAASALRGWSEGRGKREPVRQLAEARRYGNAVVTVVSGGG